jgi:hypothetical protein
MFSLPALCHSFESLGKIAFYTDSWALLVGISEMAKIIRNH